MHRSVDEPLHVDAKHLAADQSDFSSDAETSDVEGGGVSSDVFTDDEFSRSEQDVEEYN